MKTPEAKQEGTTQQRRQEDTDYLQRGRLEQCGHSYTEAD